MILLKINITITILKPMLVLQQLFKYTKIYISFITADGREKSPLTGSSDFWNCERRPHIEDNNIKLAGSTDCTHNIEKVLPPGHSIIWVRTDYVQDYKYVQTVWSGCGSGQLINWGR